MTLLDKVKILANSKKVSLAELERKLDFSQGSISRWNTQSPSGDRLKAVADYFGVSMDYLTGRTDNPKMADEAPTLLAAHIDDDLSEEEMAEVLQYIEFIRSKHKK